MLSPRLRVRLKALSWHDVVIGLIAGMLIVSLDCSHRYDASKRTVPQLISDLRNNRDVRIQAAAAQRLGRLKSSEAVESLIVALQRSPALEVRRASVVALGEIKDQRAVKPLISSLEHEKFVLGPVVAQALGKIKDGRAVGALMNELRDLREEASAALISIGEPAIGPLVACLRDAETRPYAVDALAVIGKPAVGPLIDAFNTEQKYTRYAAARALAAIPDERADTALSQALQEPDLYLARVSYRFLIRRGSDEAEDLLVQALETYGNVEMAEDLVYCGNPRLRELAQAWAAEKGYLLSTTHNGAHTVIWGAP